MLGGAGVVGLMAAGALTACAVLVLATFLPAWLAALIVAVISPQQRMCSPNAVRSAWSRRRSIPEQTIETVKEDVEWAKTRATSARK